LAAVCTLAQNLALADDTRIVATQNTTQDALVLALPLAKGIEPMLNHGECAAKAIENTFDLFRAARNVVVMTVRVNDGQTGRIDPSSELIRLLVEIAGRVHGDPGSESVELIPIEIEEVEQKFS
jgi:hypothetical protein